MSEQAKVSEGPFLLMTVPGVGYRVWSEPEFKGPGPSEPLATFHREPDAALLVAAREATEGMEDPVAALKALKGLTEAVKWFIDGGPGNAMVWCPVKEAWSGSKFSSGDEQCLACGQWSEHTVHGDSALIEFETRANAALAPFRREPGQ